jgi:hypothetical protein
MPTAQIGASLHRQGSPYTDQEIERGLVAMALRAGTTVAPGCSRNKGLSVPHSTLYRWRLETFPERCAEVRREILPRPRREPDRQHRELAAQGESSR